MHSRLTRAAEEPPRQTVPAADTQSVPVGPIWAAPVPTTATQKAPVQEKIAGSGSTMAVSAAAAPPQSETPAAVVPVGIPSAAQVRDLIDSVLSESPRPVSNEEAAAGEFTAALDERIDKAITGASRDTVDKAVDSLNASDPPADGDHYNSGPTTYDIDELLDLPDDIKNMVQKVLVTASSAYTKASGILSNRDNTSLTKDVACVDHNAVPGLLLCVSRLAANACIAYQDWIANEVAQASSQADVAVARGLQSALADAIDGTLSHESASALETAFEESRAAVRRLTAARSAAVDAHNDRESGRAAVSAALDGMGDRLRRAPRFGAKRARAEMDESDDEVVLPARRTPRDIEAPAHKKART